jgi:CRISPR-associated protein Cas8a1/Csx13
MERLRGRRPGVAATHGTVFRGTPWARQQKNRVAALTATSFPDAILDTYGTLVRDLPPRLRLRAADSEDDDAEDGAGAFVTTSALRGFLANNLASGRPWYAGFATATTAGRKPRFIHYFRARDRKNLGALWSEERKGLIDMVGKLDHAEEVLVRSIHTAIRQRFGRIAEESSNPTARANRWDGERERWRLAFWGAKTPNQIRAALADLWSRAGTNRELQERWREILPLLRPDKWQVARDLALVALASYAGERSSPHSEGRHYGSAYLCRDRYGPRHRREQPWPHRGQRHDAPEARLERRGAHDRVCRGYSFRAPPAPR